MVYDEALAQRIRESLETRRGVVEKKMFGGITFMVEGKMCVGVVKDDLMGRVGPDRHAEALAQPHARPMDFTRRTPPKGFIFVGPEGGTGNEDLQKWVTWAVDFVESLEKKS